MAVKGCACLFVLFFTTLYLHSGLAQNEANGPETNSPNPIKNATADDKLCLAGNAIVTSRRLIERFQNDTFLSKENFSRLLRDFQTGLQEYGKKGFSAHCADSSGTKLTVNGNVVNCSEILAQCPSINGIFTSHVGEGGGLQSSQLAAALQEAALALTNPQCLTVPAHKGYKPTTAQAWGYGLGFVTLVCVISNIGGLLTPLMSKTFFQRLLQFLVAMGAGTLAATGLLVLLPEAFDIVSIEELSDDYVWKSATALFSIYIFFISERFLKFFLKSRETSSRPKHTDTAINIAAPMDGQDENSLMTPLENGQSDHGHSHFVTGTPSDVSKRGPVATVAWMVLIGDVMHNFVDGMAIGAAFTENVYLGVSIGIAVICEELPHELGDVAILLHSGMTMKRALCLNFLSACVCYVGLVIGIVLGENTDANRWILAVAGGLFLYVPLVDMLPEMSQHLDMTMREGILLEGKGKVVSRNTWIVLACQSLGLFIGICIILIVVNFSGMIEIQN